MEVESVAEHTWGCCLLALLFLGDDADKCVFADSNELQELGNYDLSNIISLLIVHDLGEINGGDVPKGEKTMEDERRELQCVRGERQEL